MVVASVLGSFSGLDVLVPMSVRLTVGRMEVKNAITPWLLR